MIFQDKIDEILARADLVEIASEFVKLKNTGNSFIGLCPFHHEKTPSFHISREKQLYHRYGCGGGGNVITFLKDIPSISRLLAITS
ncbi:MAG TPA: CHC2 zinc finger domain-containing protein, partial [Ignavibacteriales bacterium]|nr:CHC2 zinc finger domain-containing protein [Ignavibacteriales bacterium]